MKLYEIMSFKTFFYFLKDTSFLDLSNYEKEEFEKEEIEDLESRESICDAFWDDMHGTDSILEIKTKFGSVIFHVVDDHEYVKKFLVDNSKNKPCAFFGSYRTSNVYMFGYAENGELKRFMYTDDGVTEILGTQTEIERQCNLNFEKEPDSCHLKDFIDDNEMFSMAQVFVPFDIENDDIEILSITRYEPKSSDNSKDKLDTLVKEPALKSDFSISVDLKNNMHNQKINTFRIFLSKNKNDNNLYVVSFLNSNDTLIKIYSDIIDFDDAKAFAVSMKNCITLLSNYKIREETGCVNNFDACYNKSIDPDFQAVIQIDLKYCYDGNYSVFENFHYVKRNKKLVKKWYNFFFSKNINAYNENTFFEIHSSLKSKCK